MKQLRKQYLDAVDRANAALRNLQTDYLELLVYDRIISGDMECEPPSLRAISIFLRACENMSAHLTEMEKACTDMQVFHREMVRK